MRKIKEDNDFLDKQSNAEYYDLKWKELNTTTWRTTS
jgi:hypothetical protein